MTIGNIEILKNNCEEFAKAKKGSDVLRNANGKRHYSEIAKIVEMHPTTVSSLLAKSEKLGLTKKVSLGVYKKIPGILGYMPSKSKNKNISPNTVQYLI